MDHLKAYATLFTISHIITESKRPLFIVGQEPAASPTGRIGRPSTAAQKYPIEVTPTVLQAAEELGFPVPLPTKITPNTKQMVTALTNLGFVAEEIAKMLQVSPHTVYHHRQKPAEDGSFTLQVTTINQSYTDEKI